MLILLLISNIGFIIGSITRTDVAKLGRRLKNATFSDYPDYESEQSRSVSFLDISEDRLGADYVFNSCSSKRSPIRDRRQRRNEQTLSADSRGTISSDNTPIEAKVESSQSQKMCQAAKRNKRRYVDDHKRQNLSMGRLTNFLTADGNDNQPNNWQAQTVNFVPYEQSWAASVDSQSQQRIHHSNRGLPASTGYSYAGYIERQAKRYPIMMYTLVQCIPCQRAKHLLAVSYADIAAHFLEFAGHEDWQRQLSVDLIRITGQDTFPYIFICGQNIGGNGHLRKEFEVPSGFTITDHLRCIFAEHEERKKKCLRLVPTSPERTTEIHAKQLHLIALQRHFIYNKL